MVSIMEGYLLQRKLLYLIKLCLNVHTLKEYATMPCGVTDGLFESSVF